MPDFKAALALVLKYEGGKVDDKDDPGGRTAFGVTQTTFDSYCTSIGVARRDVWTITQDEVAAIYRDRYAAVIRFDDLPDGIGFCTLDAAINSGPKRAAEWLQNALDVTVDGAIGPATVAAAKAKPATAVTINNMCDARLAFLRGLSTWPTYGHGWSNRVEDVRKNATAMMRVARPASASASVPTSAPAHIDTIKTTPRTGLAGWWDRVMGKA